MVASILGFVFKTSDGIFEDKLSFAILLSQYKLMDNFIVTRFIIYFMFTAMSGCSLVHKQ